MSAARKLSIPRLDEGQMLKAGYWQRKGLTLSEIAAQLGVERESVVQSIYWDRVSRRAVSGDE
jgi:plasmid maintenance system antidote protein VapI